jgi:hypothetical protein
MYRGDLTNELNWYHPRGAAIIQSFVNGINAYIEETRRNPALLTPEFRMLDLKPDNWTPAVVISRFNGLLSNVTQELNMALAVRALGADRVKDLYHFQPADPKLEIDPAIDASLLSKDILSVYSAFREPIKFTPNELVAQYRNNAAVLARLDEATKGPSALDVSTRLEDIGSNNWVVSGKLTAGGFPLMANDPHRTQSTPSLRYWVHLNAPGWNVIGGGEPALPGVSIGHNDFGAWGLTIFGTDSEDLYVYDTNPGNPNQYHYQRAWESMTVIKETIPVKGESPTAVELKYTRHGPVVYEDRRSTRRTRCAPPGGKPARHRIWPACAWTRRRIGRSSKTPAPTAASRRKTWCGPIAAATSATRPSAFLRGGPVGAAWCRSPAMAAMNGTAISPSRRFRTSSIPRRASSILQTITSSRLTGPTRTPCITCGPTPTAPTAWKSSLDPGGGSALPI